MKCTECGGETIVIDTRPWGVGIRRRRKCTKCGHRESTVEAYPPAGFRSIDPLDPFYQRALSSELMAAKMRVLQLEGRLARARMR